MTASLHLGALWLLCGCQQIYPYSAMTTSTPADRSVSDATADLPGDAGGAAADASGDADGGGGPRADGPRDLAAYDGPALPPDGPGDLGPGGDLAPAEDQAADDGPGQTIDGPASCAVWVSWSCTLPGGAYECFATCGNYHVTCVEGGACECYKSAVPVAGGCGGATGVGCARCEAAFLKGCCGL